MALDVLYLIPAAPDNIKGYYLKPKVNLEHDLDAFADATSIAKQRAIQKKIGQLHLHLSVTWEKVGEHETNVYNDRHRFPPDGADHQLRYAYWDMNEACFLLADPHLDRQFNGYMSSDDEGSCRSQATSVLTHLSRIVHGIREAGGTGGDVKGMAKTGPPTKSAASTRKGQAKSKPTGRTKSPSILEAATINARRNGTAGKRSNRSRLHGHSLQHHWLCVVCGRTCLVENDATEDEGDADADAATDEDEKKVKKQGQKTKKKKEEGKVKRKKKHKESSSSEESGSDDSSDDTSDCSSDDEGVTRKPKRGGKRKEAAERSAPAFSYEDMWSGVTGVATARTAYEMDPNGWLTTERCSYPP